LVEVIRRDRPQQVEQTADRRALGFARPYFAGLRPDAWSY
jgi:hypothetical protein